MKYYCSYEDVERGSNSYEDFIVSEALNKIANETGINREIVGDRLMEMYGGTLQIAIIDWYRNH